ncbi:hypothetical protein [Nonomuraea recticatena]|uniref:Isoprenyl transferase n=1 Tax=Nonomuraea recticatena TaxID=46178 RepID=A0ABP6DVP6_9ACTN
MPDFFAPSSITLTLVSSLLARAGLQHAAPRRRPDYRAGVLYALYTRHLRSLLRRGPLPRHVALVMDGNRRWAEEMGLESSPSSAPGTARTST